MQIDRIEKRFTMNVIGPHQFQKREFETAVFSSVPLDAQAPTPEGKQKFLDLSDKLQNVAKAIVERDAMPALQEVNSQS